MMQSARAPVTMDAMQAEWRAITACTARQARLAMAATAHGLGTLLQAVTTLMLTQPEAARLSWEYATEWERMHPLIVSLGPGLGLSATQLDALFALAQTL